MNRLVAAALGFALGVCAGMFGHQLLTGDAVSAPSAQGAEAMRVTSPDGKLDAVLVEDSSGGALGGVFWSVYVVPRGHAFPRNPAKRLFLADQLTKGAIVWTKPHLVEIHFDKASIMQFRNLSTASDNGFEYVELRLLPSSEYSLATAEGGWSPDN